MISNSNYAEGIPTPISGRWPGKPTTCDIGGATACVKCSCTGCKNSTVYRSQDISSRMDNALKINEDIGDLPTLEYVGDSLASFTLCHKSNLSEGLGLSKDIFEDRIFQSQNIYWFKTVDKMLYNFEQDVGEQVYQTLKPIDRLVRLLSDPDMFGLIGKTKATRIAEIVSSVIVAYKLLAHECTPTNIVLCVLSVVSQLKLSDPVVSTIARFVKEAVHYLTASLYSFKSQSTSDIYSKLKSFFLGSKDLLDDQVVEICACFVAKLAALWASYSGGFDLEEFSWAKLPELVAKFKTTLSEGGDIISGICGLYSWITQNFTKFFKGDFTGLYFGKVETGIFENRVSKIKSAYEFVKTGRENILEESYGMTVARFDIELAHLITTCERALGKATVQQRPIYKRYLDELRHIKADRSIVLASAQTKMTAYGVCLVGPSAVGKSVLMNELSRVIIAASGQPRVTKEMIITGSLSDKFDSNELPCHLSINYDDVANNSSHENYDKLINAVNSQSRPFLKAATEDKGKMFPNNVASVISTNIPGIKAQEKCGAAVASVLRRYLHIEVTLKDNLDICIPGTNMIDPERATAGGKRRMDIWNFKVYKFKRCALDGETGTSPEIIQHSFKLWEDMVVEEVEWSDKPEAERSFWDLALFIGADAKRHFTAQRIMLESAPDSDTEHCPSCYLTMGNCKCVESQFIDDMVRIGMDNTIAAYTVFTDWYSDLTNMTKLAMVMRNMRKNAKTLLTQSLWTGAFLSPILFSALVCLPGAIHFLAYIAAFVLLFMGATYCQYKNIESQLVTLPGILTYLARETVEVMVEARNQIFVGASIVLALHTFYKWCQPASQFLSYREQLPEQAVANLKRHEVARTTTNLQMTSLVKRDLSKITVTVDGISNSCLCFPIKGNMYVTVGHILPVKGEFEVEIRNVTGPTPVAAKQKMSHHHVWRLEGKDLALLHIPSSMPRKSYYEYLVGDTPKFQSRPVLFITMDLQTMDRDMFQSSMRPGWSTLSSSVRTDKVTLLRPYSYHLPVSTKSGMCGSVVVDCETSAIYGFHVAGKTTTGLCSLLTASDVDAALKQFKGFLPLSAGTPMLGDEPLTSDLGFISNVDRDESINLEVEEHNLRFIGHIPTGGATTKHPFRKSPYLADIIEEFGEPQFGPPQGLNDTFHKRKALTKLASPNQEFSLDEVEFAVEDYKKPIMDLIDSLPIKQREELARPLSISEALDGISESGLTGLDNSTAAGYPFGGKKKDYLVRDDFDPVIPKCPRELKPFKGIDIEQEMEKMRDKYLSEVSCMPLFKCAMKSNELLPKNKYKARVFMGCNFPFLLLCRQYFAPFVRLVTRNRFLFECGVGINMDSVEAEDLFYYLKHEDENMVVALDYSAYDQTMASQVSTAASGIILDILRQLGCSDDHIMIARGLLTDINYPVLHYFGTIFQLANSNPSGQPITTQLNSIVNSLYLRTFFYRIYPKLKGKVAYRSAVHTCTYGDDNINGVGKKYSEFNGENIVRVGAEVGLTITMADKGAEIVKFNSIYESGFLKRLFRYDATIGRIVACLDKSSITKSVYYYKVDSLTPDVAYVTHCEDMLRFARNHGQEYFEDIKAKLQRIARKNGLENFVRWWDYHEMSKDFLNDYYVNYKGGTILDVEWESQSFILPPTKTMTVTLVVAKAFLTTTAILLALEILKMYRASYKITSDTVKTIYNSSVYCISFWNVNTQAIIVARFTDECTYAKAGRLSERDTTEEKLLAEMQAWLKATEYILMLPFSSLYMRQLSSYYRTVSSLVTDLELQACSEILRPAPFGIHLTGVPGVGKSAVGMALIKDLFHEIGGISKNDIVILNESDPFQSEYKSNHRAVIFDDICNTHINILTENPLRRVIDFINNIPKRSLNPHLELKGRVKIQPDVVIATSNVRCLKSTLLSNSPYSIMRRFITVEVVKKENYQFRRGILDVEGWQFQLVDPILVTDGKHSTDLLQEITSEVLSYHQLKQYLTREFLKHRENQIAFIEGMDGYFSQSFEEDFTRYNKYTKHTPTEREWAEASYHDFHKYMNTLSESQKKICYAAINYAIQEYGEYRFNKSKMDIQYCVMHEAARQSMEIADSSYVKILSALLCPFVAIGWCVSKVVDWVSSFFTGWKSQSHSEATIRMTLKVERILELYFPEFNKLEKENLSFQPGVLLSHSCPRKAWIYSDEGLMNLQRINSIETQKFNLHFITRNSLSRCIFEEVPRLYEVISNWESVAEEAAYSRFYREHPLKGIEILHREWTLDKRDDKGRGDLILYDDKTDTHIIVELKANGLKQTCKQAYRSSRYFRMAKPLRKLIVLVYTFHTGLCLLDVIAPDVKDMSIIRLLERLKVSYSIYYGEPSFPATLVRAVASVPIADRTLY